MSDMLVRIKPISGDDIYFRHGFCRLISEPIQV